MRALVMAFAIMLMVPNAAYAICFEPDAPDPPPSYLDPSKPSEPYCLITRRCSDWEISNYRDELEAWRNDIEDLQYKLRSYVADAQNFSDEALEYAKCRLSDAMNE